MNLMEQQQDYTPINPSITFAAADMTLPIVGDIEQAIPEVDEDKSHAENNDVVDNKSNEASKEECNITCRPHTSFWSYSA